MVLVWRIMDNSPNSSNFPSTKLSRYAVSAEVQYISVLSLSILSFWRKGRGVSGTTPYHYTPLAYMKDCWCQVGLSALWFPHCETGHHQQLAQLSQLLTQQCNDILVLEMHFSWLFSSKAYLKVCFKPPKFGSHFFHVIPYYQVLTYLRVNISLNSKDGTQCIVQLLFFHL